MHGWIRVTVGLSPWEHYSAINKKINKPFYLFIFPSLPKPFDFSSPASGSPAPFRQLCIRECLQREHLREAAWERQKSRVKGVQGRRKWVKIILTISSNYITSQDWQKLCPLFIPLALMQLQVSFPQASSSSLRPPHPSRYLSVPLHPRGQLSGAPR